MLISEEVSDYIKQQTNPYEASVSLPGSIPFGEISFFTITEQPTLIFLLIGILCAFAIYLAGNHDFDKQLANRNTELLSDYPELVSKLLLLYGAGLTIQNAFQKILDDFEISGNPPHYLYQEIEYTLNKIKGGYSEAGAYADFGKRCRISPYLKLGSLLEQNLKRGTSDLKITLESEVQEAFSAHKNQVLQNGEKANSKMLLPMILILILVLALIMVPSLLSMSNL